MDISLRNVRKVCERDRDRTPSRRDGGRTNAEGRSQEAGDRTLVLEKPYSAILPTIITPGQRNKRSSDTVRTSKPLLPTTRG